MQKNFNYEFSLCCEKLGEYFSLSAIFPAVTDITLMSKKFQDVISCIASSKKLIDDVLSELNSGSDVFSSQLYTPQTPNVDLPADWKDTEVGRFVLLKNPEKMANGTIMAENIVGQARIFECEPEEVIVH